MSGIGRIVTELGVQAVRTEAHAARTAITARARQARVPVPAPVDPALGGSAGQPAPLAPAPQAVQAPAQAPVQAAAPPQVGPNVGGFLGSLGRGVAEFADWVARSPSVWALVAAGVGIWWVMRRSGGAHRRRCSC